MKKPFLVVVGCLLVLALIGSTADAATTLVLTQASLQNDPDAEGLWQYEGGPVSCLGGTAVIGHYAKTKRVSTVGTGPQNTAMVTMTIFFLPDSPPKNITLQGSHDFSSGGEIGSVSAASKTLVHLIGRAFSLSQPTVFLEDLTIDTGRVGPCRGADDE